LNSIVLNINSSELSSHVERLRKMHRSALPNAIRETLSKAALNVKQNTMPRSAKKAFTHRAPNFFKANSSVEFAKGYNVNQMKSVVGFVSTKLKLGKNNYAVKDLEQQENAGKIRGRRYMPISTARAGNSRDKLVKRANRLSEIDLKTVILTHTNRISKRSKKQAWIRAAFAAKKEYGDEAYVLGNKKNGKRTLSRINSISSNIQTRKLEIDRTPLYSYKREGIEPVKGRNFMKRASYETQSQMSAMFIKEAQKQFERNANRK
jgi:hypothetical protein